MPRAVANGIEIEYESLGSGEPILLIMGIGAQLVAWPEEFCHQLADAGYRVIRFDNRDVGLSTKLGDAPLPPIRRTILRGLAGLPVDAPYTLVDMADDAAGLLDALGIEQAHVVGVSMGGMIAQTLALVHPHRVRSLTSWMSTTGDRFVGWAKPKAIRALLGPAPKSADEAAEASIRFLDVCGSPAYPYDPGRARELGAAAWERSHYPRGFVRQLAAIMATGGRRQALRFVRAPTLVIHGTADPLILPSGGRVTAKSIPNARLEMIDGMGHDIPRQLWPRLVGLVAGHARSAPLAGEVVRARASSGMATP